MQNSGNPNPSTPRFSSTYQPSKRSVGKRTVFNRYLYARMNAEQIEFLTPQAREYLDASQTTDPNILDGIMANIISQALHPDPRVSFQAAREILLRKYGKPVTVFKLEEEPVTIEMEEVTDVKFEKLSSDDVHELHRLLEETKNETE